MSTFAQDVNGDLLVTNGKFTLVTDPASAGAQKLRNQFQIFLGEWFLDSRIGMPYYQEVFVKQPNLGVLAQLFRGVIINTPGVKSVDNLKVTFNNATRNANVAFNATWDDGSVITAVSLDRPFIVNIPQAAQTGATS